MKRLEGTGEHKQGRASPVEGVMATSWSVIRRPGRFTLPSLPLSSPIMSHQPSSILCSSPDGCPSPQKMSSPTPFPSSLIVCLSFHSCHHAMACACASMLPPLPACLSVKALREGSPFAMLFPCKDHVLVLSAPSFITGTRQCQPFTTLSRKRQVITGVVCLPLSFGTFSQVSLPSQRSTPPITSVLISPLTDTGHE